MESEKMKLTAYILIAIGMVLAVVASASMFHKSSRITNNTSKYLSLEKREVLRDTVQCKTKTCLESVDFLLSLVDEEVDPCEDFYAYACGGFYNGTKIPGNRNGISTFGSMRITIRKKLIDIMEKENKDDIEAVVKLKQMYKFCLDYEKTDDIDIKLTMSKMEKLGGYPILGENNKAGKWNSNNYDITELLVDSDMEFTGVDVFFRFSFEGNMNNLNDLVLRLTNSPLLLSKEDLLSGSNPAAKSYWLFMVNQHMALTGRKYADIFQEVNEIITFERKLAKIMVDSDNLVNEVNLAGLDNYIKNTHPGNNTISIQDYLTKFFYKMSGLTLSPDTTILFDHYFMWHLMALISETKPRIVVNYVMWRHMFYYFRYLGPTHRAINMQYSVALGYSMNIPDEQKKFQCLKRATVHMPLAVGRMYLETGITQTPNSSQLLAEYTQKSFIHLLEGNEWLNDLSKEKAIEKIQQINFNIGYSDDFLNDTMINEKYKYVNFDNTSSMQATLNIFKNYRVQQCMLFMNDNKKTPMIVPPSTTNAFYLITQNDIFVPTAMFNLPLFHERNLRLMNFAGLGSIIAHEISHAFGETSFVYDGNGDLNINDTWSRDMIDMYQNKLDCLKIQYSNYSLVIDGVTKEVNGVRTVSENMADNVGLKITVMAYKQLMQDIGKIEYIHNDLDLNTEQLFFIQFAQNWCSKSNNRQKTYLLEKDFHSPNRFRVNGAVSNSLEFSSAFKCKKGTTMNPENKCHLF